MVIWDFKIRKKIKATKGDPVLQTKEKRLKNCWQLDEQNMKLMLKQVKSTCLFMYSCLHTF